MIPVHTDWVADDRQNCASTVEPARATPCKAEPYCLECGSINLGYQPYFNWTAYRCRDCGAILVV